MGFTVVMAVVAAGIPGAAPRARSLVGREPGLVLGGTLGNLTDRLLREPGFGVGHVVDFIAVPHFAIFNILADWRDLRGWHHHGADSKDRDMACPVVAERTPHRGSEP
ncbi:signal peptidase II [Kocuria rhizophila]|nr:signal peptidase II [Kocuria rhizophila]